jgi:tRNA G37 N-methylase Trm5
VYLTDLNPKTIENLEHNAKLNDSGSSQSKGRIVAKRIDWDDESTWPTENFDYVIGSDLIYQASIVPLLRKVVLGLLKRHDGRFLYCAPDTGRDGLDDFIAAMKCDGCELVNETVAPQEYHSNPLASGDDDECFLHFHELTTSTYILYEFRINRAE